MIDTDASGRIHYSAMFRYYESAELEFLRTLGVTYADCNTCNLPRIHVECDFLRVIKLDDVIDIEVSITNIGRSSFRFEFQTFNAAQLAAKGAVVVAWPLRVLSLSPASIVVPWARRRFPMTCVQGSVLPYWTNCRLGNTALGGQMNFFRVRAAGYYMFPPPGKTAPVRRGCVQA
jgi:YbgC/YbaW family acyl-CoA thioester hydrolase